MSNNSGNPGEAETAAIMQQHMAEQQMVAQQQAWQNEQIQQQRAEEQTGIQTEAQQRALKQQNAQQTLEQQHAAQVAAQQKAAAAASTPYTTDPSSVNLNGIKAAANLVNGSPADAAATGLPGFNTLLNKPKTSGYLGQGNALSSAGGSFRLGA